MNGKSFHGTVGALLAVCAFAVTACTTQESHDHDHPMADSVAITNQWASSAETGMAAVFGTVANTGDHEAHIVSATSPSAGRVEIHQVVADADGAKIMQPIPGGLTVPSGETRELIPGGDHLMLMDLTQPLQPGADVALTVVFEDGSTLPITAQVRDFAGANEEYVPGDGSGGQPHHHD